MAFSVLLPDEQRFNPPSWRPDEPLRRVVELTELAGLRETRANLWRYPAGARGRRHVDPVQEEVFVVLEGTMTALLGDPPERFECPPRSVVVVQSGTALQWRNESEAEAVLFAYGAPPRRGDTRFLPDPD